ncbi:MULTISPECIES: hypothetical protein [Nocardioides]|uniref:Uncharacterized protein n=1 Tax=Nocardioides vastitatis TaxID=2568655 RepID=A0ABW0Z9R1_9ACTN|nr:hypothetical protein [Nocardioides sp.]THI96171.1 hypothetical protein E7Z54_17435 [Nocardioides sp.]
MSCFRVAPGQLSLVVARLLLAPSVLLLFGCGATSESPARDPAAQLPDGLVATESDGRRVTLEPIEAECVPSEYDPKVQIVRVTAVVDGSHLLIEIVPSDVEGGRTFELPIDAGDEESGPANALVFVGMMPDLEASSVEEESTGTLEVVRASCDPVEVELTIDATLASEYSDGQGLKVEGRLEFPSSTS